MDYNVLCFRSVWKDGKGTHDTEWHLADIGLSREWAIASMVKRAMRHDETLGEILLQNILQGGVEPEQPYLINDEETGVYLWFCIVPEGQELPPLPEPS
jgi:hypothetical protein